MKAYSLYAVNHLIYEDVPYPECPKGWAVVKVKAAGICSSDIPRIYKKGTYHFPTIPGHEFSGIVDKVADENYTYLIGKKVGVFPLIPCRKCEQCTAGHYEMCSHYDYIGSRRDGAFAEYVAAPIWNLIELDDSVSFRAAAMMEPLSVALHAMRIANIQQDNSVAIVGTGMIGFAAAQWAIKLGAGNVTILGRDKHKKELADAITGLNYNILDEVAAEYDVVLEAVGSNSSINNSVNIVKANGHIVFMGNPEGDITLPQDVYWRILRKQLMISGTWNSSYEKDRECDWSQVKDALNDGTFKVEKLISHTFQQNRLMDGLKLMKNHEEPYCKVMTIWND